MIDSRAIIHPDAVLGSDVEVGPYSIIGAGVRVGDGTWIGPHVVIQGPAEIGSHNRIYQFCSIGDDPQDKKYSGESDSKLQIGNGNTIREYCTINRGTSGGGGLTRVGDDNWIMAYVHIAHDCLVGSDTVFANNATLAGHVVVGDHAILGGFTGIHQFCRIGKYSLTAIASVVVKDVPPYIIAAGNTARPAGLNREGLRRHEFPAGVIARIGSAYKTVYREGLLLAEAVAKLKLEAADCPEVTEFVRFIELSERGIVR